MTPEFGHNRAGQTISRAGIDHLQGNEKDPKIVMPRGQMLRGDSGRDRANLHLFRGRACD